MTEQVSISVIYSDQPYLYIQAIHLRAKREVTLFF